jgi:hypothetical protein
MNSLLSHKSQKTQNAQDCNVVTFVTASTAAGSNENFTDVPQQALRTFGVACLRCDCGQAAYAMIKARS